jgi:excisionase family DNA binding protein
MNNKYLSIVEVAKLLKISRIAVYKKVKKGQIKAIKIGKQFAIPDKIVNEVKYRSLKETDRIRIRKAVRKTVREL